MGALTDRPLSRRGGRANPMILWVLPGEKTERCPAPRSLPRRSHCGLRNFFSHHEISDDAKEAYARDFT
jgi:hypothetical protein